MSEMSNRLTLEQLKETLEYQQLTQKQRLFCATYIAGGLLDGNYDPVAATRTAYQARTPEIARIMSYSIMQNIRIVAVLNRHFGRTPTEAFMLILDRAIRNKKLTVAQLGALRLKCEMMGLPTILGRNHPPREDAEKIAKDDRRQRKSKKPAVEKAPKPTKPTPYGG